MSEKLSLWRGCTVALMMVCGPIGALDVERPDVAEFVDLLVEEDGFERDEVVQVLRSAETQQGILDAISRPAEKSKPWHEYRGIFIQDARIDAGVAFWDEHADTIAAVSAKTGVPGEILVGIIGVETYYGRITGRYRVLDALATLGFDYPPRAKFFRRELREFFSLVRQEGLSMDTALGSYAGAMGSPQFIPSSYRAYAVDADGDGQRDLFDSWHDVIGSVANYFVRHGWRSGEPVVVAAQLGPQYSGTIPARNSLKADATVGALRTAGAQFSASIDDDEAARLIAFEGADGPRYFVGLHNFYVITRYNRSAMYAMAVWELGTAVAERRAAP